MTSIKRKTIAEQKTSSKCKKAKSLRLTDAQFDKLFFWTLSEMERMARRAKCEMETEFFVHTLVYHPQTRKEVEFKRKPQESTKDMTKRLRALWEDGHVMLVCNEYTLDSDSYEDMEWVQVSLKHMRAGLESWIKAVLADECETDVKESLRSLRERDIAGLLQVMNEEHSSDILCHMYYSSSEK